MTTIMGICCKDGIVMGSDTKEVSGTMKMSRKEKIYSYNLGNHPVLIATAGEVETIKQAVTRIDPSQMVLGEEPTLEEYLIRIVAPQISFLGREHIGTYGELPNLELLIGTVGPKIAKVYADGRYDVESRFFSAGSGSIFAEVLLRRFYNPEITLELGKKAGWLSHMGNANS